MRLWRGRFAASPCLESLEDLPRSGRPPVVPVHVRAKLISLACTRAHDKDKRPFQDLWTRATLQRALLEETGVKLSVSEIGWLRARGGPAARTGAPGSETVIQRFGTALNLNLHFHVLLLDGLFVAGPSGAPPRFQRTRRWTQDDVDRLVVDIATQCEALLARRDRRPTPMTRAATATMRCPSSSPRRLRGAPRSETGRPRGGCSCEADVPTACRPRARRRVATACMPAWSSGPETERACSACPAISPGPRWRSPG